MRTPQFIYEDNWLAIVNKPCGMVSDRNEHVSNTLEDWIQIHYKRQQSVRPVLMHRLDRATSGILIVSKKKSATVLLQSMIENRQIEKHYLALVEGVPNRKQQTLNQFFLKDKAQHKAIISSSPLTNAYQPVSINYKCIDTKDGYALLDVELITGKYHQIRSQLASITHPILGDSLYGSVAKSGILNGITLHAYKLIFIHPVTQQRLNIVSYPQQDEGLWSHFSSLWKTPLGC